MSVSASVLPVPLSAVVPDSTSTCTLAASVSLNEAWIVSTPWVVPTVTTSAELFRMNRSLPVVPPTRLSTPELDTSELAPLPATSVVAPVPAPAVSVTAPESPAAVRMLATALPVPTMFEPVSSSVLTLAGSVYVADELTVSAFVVDALTTASLVLVT